MRKLFSVLWLMAVTIVMAVSAEAAGTAVPKFHKFSYSDNAIAWKLSDNGQWALAMSASEETKGAKARLINLTDDSSIDIQTDDEVVRDGSCSVNDVTDDGNIVVGSLKGQPAWWNKTTRAWTTLPLPEGTAGASLSAVTPDGKYAVGAATYAASEYDMTGAMWDLTTGKLVELNNIPRLDMTHLDQHQQRFDAISPDGRYILASMSFSYLSDGQGNASPCSYVYDRQNQTFRFIGFTPNDTEKWTPAVNGMFFVDNVAMSPNGKWVAAGVYMVNENGDGNFPTEYMAEGRYNVETGDFELYNGAGDIDYLAGAIDNNGIIYGSTPSTSPIREWSVRYKGYWYPISLILSQVYGVDFYKTTKYDNTGSAISLNSDGTRFLSMVSPLGESYVLDLPENASAVCEKVDLLRSYVVTPADGSTFARISTVELAFDRDITVKNGATAVLKDENGKEVRESMAFRVSDKSSKTAFIRFRTTDLEDGKKYTVEIPAGVISLKSDGSKTNKAITLHYNGRANQAVKVTNIYPADHSELSKIDNSSSSVILTFDSEIARTDTASATLVNTTTGEKVSDLGVYVAGKQILLYPAATQYLYNGNEYKVTLGKGAVTDISGNGANDALSVTYHGTYVRELSHDDATLFKDDFSNISQSLINFMRYEGDHNQPTDEMVKMEFDRDNQPWNFSIRDEGSTDYCAGSTSMYTPAGQSDDWMVIPQIEIPDNNCKLTFDAQSYKKNKKDRLKVVVWESNTNINTLTSATIEKIKAEGKVVFDEQLSPGISEDELADDWTGYTVDLKDYAGKKIYICFWNNNNDQSMVFVDNVIVKRNVKYLLALNNSDIVVDKDNINIGGRLTANDDNTTFSSVKLSLLDGEGNTVDAIEKSGLQLKKGATFDFSFANPLPLVKGETNKFSIRVNLDDYQDVANSTVQDLVFEPKKRVVLEEMTGTTCVNCPQGILAIERMEKQYGDRFIPVSIHTYTGDALGNGLTGYSTYLGMSSAPAAVINREGTITYPMWSNPATGDFEFSNGATLWADRVAAHLNEPAFLSVDASMSIDEAANTFTVPLTFRSALNAKNQMLNLFMTVVEDSVISYQTNAFAAMTDPAFGEWGKGGKYGESTVNNIAHNDVVRAVYGQTYAGTAGLMPQTFKAGETYTAELKNVAIPENIKNLKHCKAIVMIIDANTNRIVNAVSVKMQNGATGITNATGSGSALRIAADGGRVSVSADGQTSLWLYTAAGSLIGSASGNGNVSVATRGYKGAVIARAVSGGHVTTKKLIVR